MTTVFTAIDPNFEFTFPCGVTVYGGLPKNNGTQQTFTDVVNFYFNVWRDSEKVINVPQDQWMSIDTKIGVKTDAAKMYPAGFQNRAIIDKEFDGLHRQGKMQWTKSFTKYGYPVFVVWRTVHFPSKLLERKGKVVVDIRGLNKITESDVYFMPLQSDIISAVQRINYIIIINCVAFFHQWPMQPGDRDKLTIVHHRKNE